MNESPSCLCLHHICTTKSAAVKNPLKMGFPKKKNLTVVSLYDAVCVYLWAPDMNTLSNTITTHCSICS